jgi:hypothetical protein
VGQPGFSISLVFSTDTTGSRSGSEADRLAAAEDWNAVGDDLRSALLEYLSEVDVETLRQLFKALTEQISDESGTQLTLSDVS